VSDQVEPYYSLAEAAARFFPGGNITARSPPTEIEHGNLPRIKIAGKLIVCESAIWAMMEAKCRDQKAPGSGSSQHMSRRMDARDQPSGLLETARRQSARAAALQTPKVRERLSRNTSQPHMERRLASDTRLAS